MARARHSAFTLIEILIVVVILGTIAAIVIVNVNGMSVQARESVLREELQFMRKQVTFYRASHVSLPGFSPSSGTFDGDTFTQQMTQFTDAAGNTSAVATATHTFAPYLSRIPGNPFRDSNAAMVKVSLSGDAAANTDDTTGWLYLPETAEFYANCSVYGAPGKKW